MSKIRRGLLLIRLRIEKIFPKLTPVQVNRIVSHGHLHMIQRDEVLVKHGDSNVPFFVVVSGEIEIVGPASLAETLVTVYDAGKFKGELNTFSGR
jgi:thioredoxin reductase (NADPH)